jgi:hypothetical protein
LLLKLKKVRRSIDSRAINAAEVRVACCVMTIWWRSRRAASLTKALLQAGARVDAVEEFGLTALQAAEARGHVQIARLLLEAAPNRQPPTGAAPLLAAAPDAAPPRAAAQAPAPEAPQRTCDACGESGARLKCRACMRARYCSKACQAAAWRAGHREQCKQQQRGAGA